MPTPSDHYSYTSKKAAALSSELQRKINIAGTLRLILFVGLIAAVWLLFDRSWLAISLTALVFIIPFVILQLYSNRQNARKRYYLTMKELCDNELCGLEYDFSAFDGAHDKISAGHSFSLDLDLFGERSFLQSINRTVTYYGRETLAQWLTDPLTDKQAIIARQEAIRELGQKTDLRQHFYVTGTLNRSKKQDKDILSTLFKTNTGLEASGFWKCVVHAVPAVWLILIVLYATGLISGIFPSLFFLVSIVLAYIKTPAINTLHNSADRIGKILSGYSELIGIIEREQFSATLLNETKAGLSGSKSTASATVKRLSKLLNALDQRGNMFIMIVNILTIRDVRIAINVEKWKRDNSENISRWFDTIARFDALFSLGGFAFNHPEYTYPAIADSYFEMRGRSLGHPLLDRRVCVKNDIDIEQAPWFMIVTGANMAGKSTYLRTIGINYLLACVGAPVCAEELSVFPARLVTSLRTSDSLAHNESYFYAELKRLKMIIDRLRSGEKLFIILDEILKGTNSSDKQKGSLALLRQLVSHGTCGIIATHDLVLGTLIDESPDNIRNYRFEAEINGDKLTFDYRLRGGVARNLNACFLMQKMGITMQD